MDTERAPHITSVAMYVPPGSAPEKFVELDGHKGPTLDLFLGSKAWGEGRIRLSVESVEWVEHLAIALSNAANELRRERREARSERTVA